MRGLTILALTALTLSSCGQKSDIDYFPMSPGRASVYSVKVEGLGLAQPVQGSLVVRIDQKVMFRGEEYSREVWASDDIPGVSGVNYYRVGSDGIYLVNEADSASGEVLYTPLPIPVGRSWRVNTPLGEVTRRATGGQRVDVDGATYKDCLRITSSLFSRESGGTTDDTVWYAPDVGIIKRSIGVGNVRMDIVLKSKLGED